MPNHNLIALRISHDLSYKLFFFCSVIARESPELVCVAFSLRAELLLNGFSDDLANYMRKSREQQERERERDMTRCTACERERERAPAH